MKRLKLGLGLLALILPAAARASDTGTYCSNNQLWSYICGAGQPDASWSPVDQYTCSSKMTGQCSDIPDRLSVFDYDQYGQLNGDVAAAGVDRLHHWRTWGKAEGRQSSRQFDVRAYLRNNPDLQAAYGTNYQAALDHFRDYGYHEGRVTIDNPTPGPNMPVKAFNPDLGTQWFDPNQVVNLRASIYRLGSGNWADHQINLDTKLDTSLITGLPNPYRLGAGATIKGPPQDPVSGKTGFYGVQQYGDQWGVSIDTRAAKGLLNEYGRWVKANNKFDTGMGTIVLEKSMSARPWRDGQVLKSSMSTRIPFAGGEGPSGPQDNGSHIVDYFFIRDVVGGGLITLGSLQFDTRESVQHFIYKNPPGSYTFQIYNIPLKRRFADEGWVTIPSWSAEFTHQTHPETRHREYWYTRANMQKIIDDAIAHGFQGLTNNPDNYEVIGYVYNPETFNNHNPATGEMTGDSWIGISGRFFVNGPTAP
ncbi:hypothetical protein [Methylobacterium sp. R2-1]|uniref:hypothetical protein n=1 Tax=Methylobacterium sp. R2-1 TaxID=2587064 RepID=UPI00160F38B6|nr:hypothetical protein [Methylobacterium sp. R2-1]MBB2965183.1 hypothetical protein [Methylobacterium sp. R2-1]